MPIQRCHIFFVVLAVFLLGPSAVAAQADRPSFQAWLSDLRAEAREAGISEGTLDAALTGLQPIERVVELDRRQPEFTQTFSEYLDARVSQARIERGRKMIARHRDTLQAVAEKYGVQPRFIAAIWGMETNYGSYLGSFSVVGALATLAYDPRRGDYFRRELINALKILDEGHTTVEAMEGSWAGAMGQSQFMPSSFRAYAQDFDGDGRRDIWGTPADVFASIANYLDQHGWSDDHTWGREVSLPPELRESRENLMPETPPASCRRALKEHTMRFPLSNWQALGVRRTDGSDLPQRPGLPASLVVMGEEGTRPFLTYPNFRALLSYNCSNFYALAVGHLADALWSEVRAERP